MKPSIEISSICNLRCKMCPYQHKDIEQGLMEWDLFTKLADELAPLSEAIHIFNRGEPFTHPRVYEMIDYIQEKGIKAIIATNALLMDEKKILEHLKNGLLVISCHAGDRETYKKITGTDGFDEVRRKIIWIKNNNPHGNLEFGVKFVKLPENNGQEKEVEGFGATVYVVEDSNQSNPYGYIDCSQPDVCPTWDFKGHKKVCCRDEYSKYDYDKYYGQAKRRELDICQRCAIH